MTIHPENGVQNAKVLRGVCHMMIPRMLRTSVKTSASLIVDGGQAVF